jgi:hypothetical protein
MVASDLFCIILVGRGMSEEDIVRSVKTFRLHLPVVDTAHVDQLLDLVTDVDGVVGALLDTQSGMLHVMVARDASALLVREQLLAVAA